MSDDEVNQRLRRVRQVHRQLLGELSRNDQHVASLNALSVQVQRLLDQAKETNETLKGSVSLWANILADFPGDIAEIEADEEADAWKGEGHE